MKNIMEFDGGYKAVIAYDPETEMFRGEFISLNGGADFCASDAAGLKAEGKKSLEVFLRVCEEDGVSPRKAQAACAPWSVTALEVLPAYRLKVRFHDGSSGIVDMSRLIHSPDAGVFAPLADESLFAQAFISHGAVTWPGESPDLAPDAMHKAIITTGEWIP